MDFIHAGPSVLTRVHFAVIDICKENNFLIQEKRGKLTAVHGVTLTFVAVFSGIAGIADAPESAARLANAPPVAAADSGRDHEWSADIRTGGYWDGTSVKHWKFGNRLDIRLGRSGEKGLTVAGWVHAFDPRHAAVLADPVFRTTAVIVGLGVKTRGAILARIRVTVIPVDLKEKSTEIILGTRST